MEIDLGKRFLEVILDLKVLSPVNKIWSEKEFESNPPRYYRYLQLKALGSALDISLEPMHEFQVGRFIGQSQFAIWDDIYAKIKANFEVDTAEFVDNDQPSIGALQHLFSLLFSYQEKLNALKETGSTVLAASGYFITPLEILHRMKPTIKQDLDKLEEVLILLINPKQKKMTALELAAQFDYPLVDLDEIDLEWM